MEEVKDEVKEVKEEVKEQNVNINVDMNEVNETLKKINKTLININDKVEEENEDTNFYVSSINDKKYLVNERNEKMTNYDIFKKALHHIDNDNINMNLHPNFITYMRKYVDNVDSGGNEKDFMDREIYKEIDVKNLKFGEEK